MAGLFRTANQMEDLALFTRHVAGAMDAKVPLPDILRAFVLDAEGGQFARAVDSVADRIEFGVELSVAMEDHPASFPAAYRRLVRLGEQGKTLGEVMAQSADSIEESLKSYEYFRRAAIYPLLITVLLFLNLCFLNYLMVPRLQNMISGLGGSSVEGLFINGATLTPSALRIVLAAFGLMLLFPIMFLIATVMGLRMSFLDYGRLQLQLPLIGPVLRRAETARFANHLALLLANRLPLAEALGLLADSSENSYVRASLQEFHRRFQEGEGLGELIASQPLFPAGMASMIASAEDQGGLARTLKSLGRFYADRTSHGLTVLREIFEPVLLLLIGLLVALILLTLYTPVFSIAGMIR